MYRSPSGARAHNIPDGPISELTAVLENTNPEDWQKRTQTFSKVVAAIPSGSAYSAEEMWYNSPATLRHLAWPMSELLKDLRSTVVKRTCEASAELFAKCQSDARYLLKDLMGAILGVHAQTVQVIRSAVQTMVVDALSVTPCKMAMPIWLDRLKSAKSRTVREACCLYLGVGLAQWTEVGYLSLQVWDQVGTALVKALRDPAPPVRQNAKKGLEIVFQQQPNTFDSLLGNSALVRDARVKKLLQRIQDGEAVGDDVSVASSRVGSVASRSIRNGGTSVSFRNQRRTTPRAMGRGPVNSRTSQTGGIPAAIVAAPKPTQTVSLTDVNPSAARSGLSGLGPPVRVPGPFRAAVQTPPRKSLSGEPETPYTNGTPVTPDPALSASFDTADTESDLPVIASSKDLREFAKTRGSRRSSLLQEHFARASLKVAPASNGLDAELDLGAILDDKPEEESAKEAVETSATESGEDTPPVVVVSMPEHLRIANDLLEVHKRHVDQIMETLKVEMDALKEFELVVLEGIPGRPTEDEVLEYFESVGLCLEQRAKAGTILQKKMDKISSGGS